MDSKRYISLEYISMAEALHCPYTLLTDAKLTSLRAYNEWLSKFELQLEGHRILICTCPCSLLKKQKAGLSHSRHRS